MQLRPKNIEIKEEIDIVNLYIQTSYFSKASS